MKMRLRRRLGYVLAGTHLRYIGFTDSRGWRHYRRLHGPIWIALELGRML